MLHHAFAVDANGHVTGNPIAGYIVTDGPTLAEAANDILYYLGVAPDGSWMIRKRTISLGTERFASGRGDAATAWANKASQTYDRTNVIF